MKRVFLKIISSACIIYTGIYGSKCLEYLFEGVPLRTIKFGVLTLVVDMILPVILPAFILILLWEDEFSKLNRER